MSARIPDGRRTGPGEPEVLVLPDPAAVSRAAAERIADVLGRAIASRGVAHFATTGGSTPGPIYEALVAAPLRERLDWRRVQLWWGDDRFVPRGDELSNVRLVDRILAGPGGVALPGSSIHPVPVDATVAAGWGPAEAAARYAAEISASVPAHGGWPAFDLMIVGIGPDGHLLSVFPGSVAFDSGAVALPIPAPTHVEPRVARVTLNPRVLDAAGALLAIVHGSNKAAVLGAVFGPERDERRWPAQRARRRGATWFLDRAAAAGLPAGAGGGRRPRTPGVRPDARADVERPGAAQRRSGAGRALGESSGDVVFIESSGHVVSRDETLIAWSRYGTGEPAGTPLLLVHGTTADHTTFRVIGPRLAERHLTIALDRRGRGGSGDRPPYSIGREYEDVAAVAAAMARATGESVDVLGHSYGGRCAMGAALIEPAIRRVVSYEGAVPAGIGLAERDPLERLEALDAAGRPEELLRVFLTEVVEMTPAEWEAFRTSPVWPERLAAAHTVAREVRAGAGADPAWERYSGLAIPVLQVLGSESAQFFRAGAEALDARLRRGRLAVIQGARHNAHHTHVDELLAVVEAFLGEPDEPRAVRSPTPGRRTTIRPMSETMATASAAPPPSDDRPYSPGLEGVIAGESSLGYVDGANGRLLYRGYRIGDLVERGSFPAVAELLWTGEWRAGTTMPTGRLPEAVLTALRALPRDARPMDALRTAVSAWGAGQRLVWPPTVEQARELTAFSPTALAAFARIRQGLAPVDPDPGLDLVPGFLYQLTGGIPDPGTARALDAYFICGAEHGFNASTFAARVIVSTRSDMASAVAGAIGAMKGPLHGGAPSEVVEQIHQVGSPERAERWVRDALDRGERLMGFGHRVYRAYDPRAAALRKVAQSMERRPEWLDLAIEVEDVALRVLAERHPERPLKTNVEYYAAAVLMGVGLTPDLFPATFALARHAGWTAHILEQAAAAKLMRPDARYVGPAERDLPA